jgi:membrane-associated protein
VTFLDQLHGPAFLGALCLVIFVEECGVPLPFAPGDLLLVACGLAIRRRGLEPLLAVPAVYLSTIAGAMAGREVFDVAGARLLRWLTGSKRLAGGVDRAARLLRRGGWPAVLLARITPGLRITTTEVAGLLRLPRGTFLAGLAPGAALYVAVFVTAGWLFGREAIGVLLHLVDRVGLGVTVLLLLALWVAGMWLGGRLLRRGEGGAVQPTGPRR